MPICARGSARCPHCGKYFSSVQCPRCGYKGDERDFDAGCPECGSQRVKATATVNTELVGTFSGMGRIAREVGGGGRGDRHGVVFGTGPPDL